MRDLHRRSHACLLLATTVMAGAVFPARGVARHQDAPDLKVDPLLIGLAAEAWTVLARDDNPVWPGWNAADTPLLFYRPGVQDVLVNHPSPPKGFAAFEGLPDFLDWDLDRWDLQVRDGETVFDLDGQNTSRAVGGVETLVLADTTSNGRNQLRLLLEGVAGGDAPPEDLIPYLWSDPYDQLAMVAHEAFHVFQRPASGPKAASELLLLQYPVLSVDNNVGFALEGRYLGEALRARSPEALRAAALRWWAARQERRALLPAAAVEYEDGTEWNEGLAKYVEYRLFQVLEGREATPALSLAQGFHGFADLRPQREALLTDMEHHLAGEVNVNNAPYGTAPLRMRLYFSGMAIGALLDRLGADWQEAILQPGTTLAGLAEAALAPTDEERTGALRQVQEDPAREALVARKTRLAEEGARDLERLLSGILEGPATTLLVDYSGLGVNALAMSFTPFGLRVVDEDRTIYTMLPFQVRFLPGYQLQQSRPAPLLQDQRRRQVAFQLEEALELDDLLDALDVPELDDAAFEDLVLELPGVTLEARRARVRWQDGRITLLLER